jgi:hypothetical protein
MTAQKYLGSNPRWAKAVVSFYGMQNIVTGREQNGRRLPFWSQGGNDSRQKITPRPGLA